MNDSNQKEKATASPMETNRRRKSGIIKSKSRRQRRRLAEIFFINTANIHKEVIIEAISSGKSFEQISEEKIDEMLTKKVMRFTTLQYFERHLSGPKPHVRRQIKFKVKRRSSPKWEQLKPNAGLALLAGSQPTGAR